MLTRLHIQNLRNLEDVWLRDLGLVNVLYGENGSGKTSVLEAIHCLSLGRSFRSLYARPVVRHGSKALLVFGELSTDGTRIGIRREITGRAEIHVNGEHVRAVSELAQRLPLQLINSASFDLVEGPPAVRRHWLDWAMFHVEPSFHATWRAATRALRQRNALLRHGRMGSGDLALWNREYARHGEELASLRSQRFEATRETITQALEWLGEPLGDVAVELYRGWPADQSLASHLEMAAEKDQASGQTRYGPHRADVRIKVGGQAAADTLSRGQTKMLVCALKLSQLLLVDRVTRKKSVLLLDDLAAELDAAHRARLCEAVRRVGSQVFLTVVSPADLENAWPQRDELSWFHVEHGEVQPTRVGLSRG